jgi:hypothetical protein
MSKVIRVRESTYNELVGDAHYQDTIDGIIQRLLKYKKSGVTYDNE